MRFRLWDNLGLKLVSLVLAFSLWYIVAGERGTEIVLSIPLEFRNLPEGLEVIEESAQQVDVRLRGSSEFLRALSPQAIQAAMDLADAKPGHQTVYLTPSQVETPYGVRVIRVTPASVNLVIEALAERTVQVVPRVVGEPAAGFVLTNIRLQPPEITISGPASTLENLEQLTTEPISAEGLRETYSQSLQILIDDPFVRLIDVNSVEVTLEVQEESVEDDSADPDAEDSSGPSGSSGRPGQTGQTGQNGQAGRASG
jgi:YbbR domain-containing protein